MNGKKAESRAAMLTVRPFRIISQPSGAAIDLGGTAYFSVKAEGLGMTYQWQWQAPGSSSWSNTSISGANTATLTVKDPPASFNGRKYRCVIKNSSGKQLTTNAAALTVINLTITAQPQNTTAESLASAVLTVKASGTGLKYQWQWQAPGSTTWQNTSLTGATTNTLRFTDLPFAFNGRKYRCVVKNVNGKTVTSSAATLTVKPDRELYNKIAGTYNYFSTAGYSRTEITINKDGSFYGISQSGMTIQYKCDYYGQLSNVKKLDNYTFSMRVSDYHLIHPAGSTGKNGDFPVEYFDIGYADKEFLVYLPGHAGNTLPEAIKEDLRIWEGSVPSVLGRMYIYDGNIGYR